MIEEVMKELKARNETISFAESCTGGKLSAHLVSQSGISAVYMGTVVAYSNSIKEGVLGVPSSLLRTVGAVSSPVSLAMARGVRDLTNSSWAVSITGIAGPDGGTETKPVGTVCFAFVGPGFERTYRQCFTGDRESVQNQSVDFVVKNLITHLKGE